VILLVQSYSPECKARRLEIEFCKRVNSKSDIFSHVVLVDGDARRWTIGQLFDICHAEFKDEICVVANSDIVFDESILAAKECLKECNLLALTRWENKMTPRMLGHYDDGLFFSGTQDSWIFVGGSIPAVDIEIPMGHVACDNVLVGWAVKKGVVIADPAIDLRTYHVHAEESRPEREIVFGYYGYPELTTTSLSRRVLCHLQVEEGFQHICKFT